MGQAKGRCGTGECRGTHWGISAAAYPQVDIHALTEAQAGEIAQEIDMLKDAIKAEMTAQNVTEMQVDVFRIRWASVQSC